MLDYEEGRFRRKVDAALSELRKTLSAARHPVYAPNEPHVYDDKFGLANFVNNTSLAAQLNCLEALGLDEQKVRQCVQWVHSGGKHVTLGFYASEQCEYLRECTREVQSKTKHVSENTLFGKSESKSVTRITEHFWKYTAEYKILVFHGDAPAEGSSLALQQRAGSCEIMTSTAVSPRPASTTAPPKFAALTWFFKQISTSLQLSFAIDRTAEACHTPRRNEQVESALSHGYELHAWAAALCAHLSNVVFPNWQPTSTSGADGGKGHALDLAALRRTDIFVPVLPILETGAEDSPQAEGSQIVTIASSLEAPKSSPVLGLGDIQNFLRLQRATLDRRVAAIASAFPPPSSASLISAAEASLVVLATHLQEILQQLHDSVDCIEQMLRKQLVTAVGRELSPRDFSKYMEYHNQKLFRPAYKPQPFCFAVRRPDHYPEGTVSIEAEPAQAAEASVPIHTLVSSAATPSPPMSFRLSAATRVLFSGERHLHAHLAHAFEGETGDALALTARARQFSCFMLLLGAIGPNATFEPKHAIILQNKDELRIPLSLEQLPSAKAFRDAIESLSPEQQRFAKAYRSMQLEGSLFAVLIVQIKPQLETLLRLPGDALTKEIKLTQQLLTLFMEHQIPPDLLSFGGDASADVATKLAQVRSHVAAIMSMIDEAKKAEVEDAKQKFKYQHPQSHAFDLSEAGFGDSFACCGAPQAPTGFGDSFAGFDDSFAPPKAMARTRPKKAMSRSAAPPPIPMMQCAEAPTEMQAVAGASFGGSFGASPVGSGIYMGGSPRAPKAALPGSNASRTDKAVRDEAPQKPQAEAQRQLQAEAQRQPERGDESDFDEAEDALAVDYTKLPAALDAELEKHDIKGSLRPTNIIVGEVWTRKAQQALLAPPSSSLLDAAAQRSEKDKAFDLLDALSRSGAEPLSHTALHVVLAATHCFDRSLIDTLVVDGANPIEKLELSNLLVAATIHDDKPSALVRSEHHERLATYSAPSLMPPLQQQQQQQ